MTFHIVSRNMPFFVKSYLVNEKDIIIHSLTAANYKRVDSLILSSKEFHTRQSH